MSVVSVYQVNPRAKRGTRRSGTNVNSTWTERKHCRSIYWIKRSPQKILHSGYEKKGLHIPVNMPGFCVIKIRPINRGQIKKNKTWTNNVHTLFNMAVIKLNGVHSILFYLLISTHLPFIKVTLITLHSQKTTPRHSWSLQLTAKSHVP